MLTTFFLDYKGVLEPSFKKNVVGTRKELFSISKYRVLCYITEYPGTVKCSVLASGL